MEVDKTKIDALKSFCRAMELPAETATRIMAAARGDTATAKSQEALLTGRQAAQILGCHPKTLFAYRRAGKLKSIRRSARCIRWRKSEIEKLAFEGV